MGVPVGQVLDVTPHKIVHGVAIRTAGRPMCEMVAMSASKFVLINIITTAHLRSRSLKENSIFSMKNNVVVSKSTFTLIYTSCKKCTLKKVYGNWFLLGEMLV